MYSRVPRANVSVFCRAVLPFSLALLSLSNIAFAQTAFDLHGKALDPFRASRGKTTVLIFARTDCPIANRYAPLLQQMNDAHKDKVNFWLVYPDKNTTAGQISQHLRQFAISIPALRDPSHSLVKQASVTITPEVAVFDGHGRMLYHGRVDNLYETAGRPRSAATTHELEDVLNSAIAGKPAPFLTAPAVGCYISDLE